MFRAGVGGEASAGSRTCVEVADEDGARTHSLTKTAERNLERDAWPSATSGRAVASPIDDSIDISATASLSSMPPMPTWQDAAAIDLRKSIRLHGMWPRLDPDMVERALRRVRRVSDVFPWDQFEGDDAARYYVALRALPHYEAALIPMLKAQIQDATQIASKQKHRRDKREKKEKGLFGCFYGMRASPCDYGDGVGVALENAPTRYKAGLEDAFAVLSLGDDLTLTLIACARLAEQFSQSASKYDLQRNVRRFLKVPTWGDASRTEGEDFIAEREFFQLAQFAEVIRDVVAAGRTVRLRAAPSGMLLDGAQTVAAATNGEQEGEQTPESVALPRSAIRKLQQSLDSAGNWPAVNAWSVTTVLSELRRDIDARIGDYHDAFASFSEARLDVVLEVLTVYETAFLAVARVHGEIAESELRRERRSDYGDAPLAAALSAETPRTGEPAPSRGIDPINPRTAFLDGLPLFYKNGLRALFQALSLGSDEDLANTACEFLQTFAETVDQDFRYVATDYVGQYRGLYDQMLITEARDRERARKWRRNETLWVGCLVANCVAATTVPSRPQYKHLVADAQKAADQEARRHARDLAAYRSRAGIMSLHAMLPMAAALVREATKVKPRFTSDTIFEYAERKNACDRRLVNIQTMQYRNLKTDYDFERQRVDQRLRVPGGWAPVDRIAGFNALPPGVRPKDVHFMSGQNDIGLQTRYRNGYVKSENLSSSPIAPPPERPFGPTQQGHFPRLQLRTPESRPKGKSVRFMITQSEIDQHRSFLEAQALRDSRPPEPVVPQPVAPQSESTFRPVRDGRFPTLRLRHPPPN